MKQEVLFKFIGNTDEGMGYVNGHEYALELMCRGLVERITGVFIGIPFSWKLYIAVPLFCPYENFDCFEENWEFKSIIVSDKNGIVHELCDDC